MKSKFEYFREAYRILRDMWEELRYAAEYALRESGYSNGSTYELMEENILEFYDGEFQILDREYKDLPVKTRRVAYDFAYHKCKVLYAGF